MNTKIEKDKGGLLRSVRYAPAEQIDELLLAALVRKMEVCPECDFILRMKKDGKWLDGYERIPGLEPGEDPFEERG